MKCVTCHYNKNINKCVYNVKQWLRVNMANVCISSKCSYNMGMNITLYYLPFDLI